MHTRLITADETTYPHRGGHMSHVLPSWSESSTRISDATITELHDAIRRRLSGEPLDGELHRAVRHLSSEARTKGLRPEQVLIILKHVWSEVPVAARTPARTEQREILEDLVTRCIEEFCAQE